MTKQRQKTSIRPAPTEKQPAVDKLPAPRSPVQREIQKLLEALNAFNERIVELEKAGHKSHAMKVLKVNAMDFARQIDELRSLLVTR